MRAIRWMMLALLLPLLAGCGYNRIQQADEDVKAQWSEVLNQYQRRADLIPNLVATVRGYATHEEKVLVEVTNARAHVGSAGITAEQAADPAKLAQFQAAQGELSSALGRLLVVTENYPDLKANQNFLELQSQLEGTENRITVARNRYIAAVQEYNVLIRQFPVNLTAMMFGYKQKPNFSVENEAQISKPPTVDFNTPAAPAPAAPPAAAPAPAASVAPAQPAKY
jgi:LemA protein